MSLNYVLFGYRNLSARNSCQSRLVAVVKPNERKLFHSCFALIWSSFVDGNQRQSNFVQRCSQLIPTEKATVCDVLNVWIMGFDRALSERNGYVSRFHFGWSNGSGFQCQNIVVFHETNAKKKQQKRRNRRSLSRMLVQIVLLRDIEWGSSLAELKTWMSRLSERPTANWTENKNSKGKKVRTHIRCFGCFVRTNAWPCMDSLHFPLPSFTRNTVVRLQFYCLSLSPRTRTTRFPYSPILLVHEIRRIDIYSKHVRNVFDTRQDEQATWAQKKKKKKSAPKNPRLNRAQAHAQAFTRPDFTRMPAFIFPFFFVRRNLLVCVYAYFFLPLSRVFLALILHNHRISIENKCFGRNPFRVYVHVEQSRVGFDGFCGIFSSTFLLFSFFFFSPSISLAAFLGRTANCDCERVNACEWLSFCHDFLPLYVSPNSI